MAEPPKSANVVAAPALVVLVVGDVHGCWDEVDRTFVEQGEQRLVAFVGDFGDEDVAVVERIAALTCEKVVVLGNHDAWFWCRRERDDRAVKRQLEILAEDHIGYGARALGPLAVVGGRPFSWGGPWRRTAETYRALYGIGSDEDSARKILNSVKAIPTTVPLLIVAHNGPFGLGAGRDAIFGCDFRTPHVDFGDRDLELAIAALRDDGRRVVACVAGHMHERLVGGGERKRVALAAETVHLNAAVVPRHRRVDGSRARHFLELRFVAAALVAADDIWVGDLGDVRRRVPLWPTPTVPGG